MTPDGIGHRRADIAADGARRRRGPEAEMAGGGEIARKGHDDLGGKRDAGGFDRHHQRHAEKARCGDRGDDETREHCDDVVKQSVLSGAKWRA